MQAHNDFEAQILAHDENDYSGWKELKVNLLMERKWPLSLSKEGSFTYGMKMASLCVSNSRLSYILPLQLMKKKGTICDLVSLLEKTCPCLKKKFLSGRIN